MLLPLDTCHSTLDTRRRRYTDAETGLVYFGHRYYHPGMGRFLYKDPLGEAGGLNRYAYALNDPVNRTDYRGLCYTGPVGLTGWRYSHSDASIIDVSIITDANYVLDSILPGGLSTGGDLPYDVLAVDENGNALVNVTDRERFDNLVSDWEAANPGSNAVVPRDQWSGSFNSDGTYSFQVTGPAPWESGTPWNEAGQSQTAQGGQSGGGSAVGNALRRVPLVGGLLGGVGDAVSGVGNMAIGNFGRGFSQLGQGIGGTANILARDAAATLAGAAGTVYTIGRSVSNVMTLGNVYSNGNILHAIGSLVWDAVVPNYGMFGGPNWGTTQGRGRSSILNQGDVASYHHDENLNEIEWIKRNYTTSPEATPIGPVGVAYALIGTVPFGLKGLIDGESYP